MLYEFDHQILSESFPVGETTDEQLLRMVQSRDEDALKTLFFRHKSMLFTVVQRVVNDYADSEDVVEESLQEIWNRASTFDEKKGRALGWMITMVRRRAIDRVRRRGSYLRAQERFAGHLHDIGADKAEVEESVETGGISDSIRQALATLPTRQKEVLELAYFGGLSQREIARKTGTPLGTIKTRLELALKKMRASLGMLGDKEAWLAC